MAKVTADTITDEQIRELREDAARREDYDEQDVATAALRGPPPTVNLSPRVARARCAEIYNTRTAKE